MVASNPFRIGRKPIPTSVRFWNLFAVVVMVAGPWSIQTARCSSSNPVQVWEEPLILPTYNVGADDLNPMFKRPLSYQGAHRVLYPYPAQDNFTNMREEKAYTALYLENEYIKLCVLPELGGRLFYATDKTNNYELFYRQHVIKPAHIGMLGAWISGGIEWCVFHHHRASTFLPVDYHLQENKDGSGTIWIGELEPRHRMRWTIGITLHPGRSFIQADVNLFNNTPETNSILYWANVATHVNDDYQVFFPPTTKYGVYHAKNDFIHWPIGRGQYQGIDYTGVDASWWKNHPKPISIFAHEIDQGFLAGYDHGRQAGTMHVANHHIVAGAKLWEWGPSEEGSMWDTKVLTDSDGPYAELMVGAYSDNQPDYSWIKPYETKKATHYWYPLRQMGGVKAGNLDAAMNLDVEGEEILIAVNTTARKTNAQVRLTAGEQILLDRRIDVGPDHPFQERLPLPEAVARTDLKGSLISSDGTELVHFQPITLEVPDELPERVRPPAPPESIETVEQLYLTGLRIRQFHNARIDPIPYFEEALQRDPGDSRSHIQMGLIAFQKGLLDEAEQHFQAAIDRIGKDYTRPRDAEAYYHLGRVLKAKGHLQDAYNQLYRAVWDYEFRAAAYYELAAIAGRRGDVALAEDLLRQSLETNAINVKAHGIRSSALRKLGTIEPALASANRGLSINVLDPMARHQRIASLQALKRRRQRQTRELETLTKILHENPESYLETAVDYIDFGFYSDAEQLLTWAVQSPNQELARYPTIHYYLAYLCHLQGREAEADRYLESAAECPTDYCFPFRMETLRVYEYALSKQPENARVYYYRGNLLYDHQPERAIQNWEKAVQLDPGLAIAFRNLGWGNYYALDDLPAAIRNYTLAIVQNREDPRYYYELDLLHERNGTPVDKRLDLLRDNHRNVEKHPLALVREIMVLVQAGEYDTAIDYLSRYYFPIQEGNRGLHETHVDARLLRGLQRHQKGDFQAALNDFLAAAQYPENQQVGRRRGYERESQILFLTGLAHQSLGREEEAQALFQEVARMVKRGQGNLRDVRNSFAYYSGLALRELGDQEGAEEVFDRLITRGREMLEQNIEVDFFSKFGEGDLPHVHRASAHYMIGLGELGKRNREAAREAFQRAVELDVNHLWAHYELGQLDFVPQEAGERG